MFYQYFPRGTAVIYSLSFSLQKGEHTRNGEIRRNIEIFLNPIKVEAGYIYNHAPEGYTCPFCLLVSGIENEHVRSKQRILFIKIIT